MAAANSYIQLAGLDFNTIKNNFINYLKGQDTFKDYNFEGSGLSVLTDVLAYNTQYNAFYLNMVANEMFLDTALQRSSVVSHAKLLNYTPKSAIAPTAFIKVQANNVTTSSLTLPAYTNFLSESVNGVNYNFVTIDNTTVNVSANTAIFNDIEIKQGLPVRYSFVVDSTSNPQYTFELPDSSIDTTTLQVKVQKSVLNSSYSIYNVSTDSLTLTPTSEVYFLQEALNGNYQVYFGDGILGKKLDDGNVIIVSYIITQGKLAAGANNFVLMDSVSGFNTVTIYGITPASTGGEKETIDSIKYQAPKSYSAQNRAVTKEDYITLIQQNKLGYSFDAVNVWGGEENDPPVYGQVFICLKPTGSYTLTQTQKQKIIQQTIKPVSVMTVEPTVVDPDYTYIKLNVNVVYDAKKTTSTANQIGQAVTTAINNFATTTLNTFNSTFAAPDLTTLIQNADPSIVTNEVKVQLQKKFYPNLTTPETYNFYYGVELAKGMFLSGINSSPAVQYLNPLNKVDIIDGIYIEEVPSSTGGVESISLINPGFGYQTAPKVTIQGDGTGATAEAVINTNGTIRKINVLTSGNNYTSAIATITSGANDTTGQLGAAVVNLQGRYGTLRSYYNNTNNVKTVFNQNIGTVDYKSGLVTLNSFGPIQVDNDLGQLTITTNPATTIISSSYNRIITIDPFDPSAITVNVTAK
jgi:hypothetical protein